MRFSLVSTLVVALAADAVVGSWFSKAAYNNWHETELERWLSDHDVPYPTPADRKDLENLVKENWNNKVGSPYSSWDANQLQDYLTSKGQQAKKGTEKNKDSLISQVKSYWYETEDQASDAYNSVKDWIFDSWSDSQLKAFLDRHGIPNPQPHTRDSLLKSARENYQSAATKAGETVAYPGNWLYESWSESDLKAWLDERGVPVPQGSTRDKLIASVRRNSRYAGKSMSSMTAAAAASAASATQSLSDALLDSWSDSQIKEWADKNGIKVPQGSKRNELIALARKHRGKFSGESVASSGSSYASDASASGKSAAKSGASSVKSGASAATDSGKSAVSGASASVKSAASGASASADSLASEASGYVGAATSSAGNQYAKATDDAAMKAEHAKGIFGSLTDRVKHMVGLAASTASSATDAAYASASSAADHAYASGKSVKDAAGASGKSAASAASASAESAASAASASASSGKSKVSKGAQKAYDAATESATSGKHRASEAAQKASDYAKEEL